MAESNALYARPSERLSAASGHGKVRPTRRVGAIIDPTREQQVKPLKIALVGATGAVGRAFLEVLEEKSSELAFELESVRLCASPRSEGTRIPFRGQDLLVEAPGQDVFAECDIAFMAAGAKVAKDLAPEIVAAGCLVIDKSSAYRLEPDVPLVVPEINGDDVDWNKGILATPNCSTTQLVMALWPLHQKNPIKRIIVDTYQSVSGTGGAAMTELDAQTRDVLAGKAPAAEQYPHQIAFNVLPQIDGFRENGYTVEEQKMAEETHKIMGSREIAISATCVRVPVVTSHSEALHVEFEHPMSPGEARELLSTFKGVVVVDDPATSSYPMPIVATGKDDVFVGRIRQDVSAPGGNGLAMWVVADNLRKGAATNAIQIAEEVVNRDAWPQGSRVKTRPYSISTV